jgi:hypothetical protein
MTGQAMLAIGCTDLGYSEQSDAKASGVGRRLDPGRGPDPV